MNNQDPEIVISVAAIDSLWVLRDLAKCSDRLGATSRHVVIVPSSQIKMFERNLLGSRLEVFSEDDFVDTRTRKEIKLGLHATGMDHRYGWYLQQFIKLNALQHFSHYQRLLIWDADTIPTRPIRFFSGEGQPILFSGKENHKPYFDFIWRAFELGKAHNQSFISQSFPITKSQIIDFFEFISKDGDWVDRCIRNIDFSEGSGFSEYELLGTVVYRASTPLWQSGKWTRGGNAICDPSALMNRPLGRALSILYDFMAFESWAVSARESFLWRSRQLFSVIGSLLSAASTRHATGGAEKTSAGSEELLNSILERGVKTVIQVGANDGVQSDPLRKHLLVDGRIQKAVLIEPIPFYVSKLRELYAQDSRVEVRSIAVGTAKEPLRIFFIPPVVADQMNEALSNDWAHGQGSSDRSVVEYWIRANSWRGPRYLRQIPMFLGSIEEAVVEVLRLEDIIEDKIDLVVIDVQGMEADVVSSLGAHRPDHIFVETDGSSEGVEALLLSMGYEKMSGGDNSLFRLAERPS